MFPSSGYFRSITCPFFANGFCERPHCHFRHIKTVSATTPQPAVFSSRSESRNITDEGHPDLLKLVRAAVLQIQKEVEENKSTPNTPSNGDFGTNFVLEECKGAVDDQPLNAQPQPKSSKKSKSTLPEYRPTPISQLKKLQEKPITNSTKTDSQEYDPTSSSKSKKIDSVDYTPSPKIPYVPVSKNKQVINVEYVPNPIKEVKSVDISDGDSQKFSDSEEEDKKVDITDSRQDKSGPSSNFDIVNMIIKESKTCDKLISAAVNRRKESQDDIGEVDRTKKTENSKKTDRKLTKNSTSSVSSSSSTAKSKSDKAKKEDKKSSSKNVKNSKSDKGHKNSDHKSNKDDKHKSKKSPKDVSKVSSESKKSSKSSSKSKSSSDKKSKVTSKPVANGEVRPKKPEVSKSDKIDLSHLDKLIVDSEPLSDIADEDMDYIDEHDTYEECLKIFNEYQVNTNKQENAAKKPKEEKPEEDACSFGKRRIAHVDGGASSSKRMCIAPPRSYVPSPSQVMHERIAHAQKQVKEIGGGKSKITLSRPIASNNTESLATGKKRIAHVPPTTRTTPATQASTAKGTQRAPIVTKTPRPTIPAEFGSRVPVNIRQRYLNLLIDECLKIYDTEKDAYERGLAEEKNAYERSTNRTVYLNVVANTIKRLRNEQVGCLPTVISPTHNSAPVASTSSKPSVPRARQVQQRTLSHEFVLGGKKAANTSFSIERNRHKASDETFSGAKLYHALKRYILTPEQLEENGYPLTHPSNPSRVLVKKHDSKNIKFNDPMEKLCDRCGKGFKVTEKGIYLTRDECLYHYGRPYKFRHARAIETRYSCCQGGLHSEPCSVAMLHVYINHETDFLKGFVKTLPKSPPPNGDCGVFALDCEMSYTTMGSELTRVTVVGPGLNSVYESLVKPENEIVDYNTRFSGITEEDLKNVHTTLLDVQAVIMSLCSDKTILIGHSLESDLKALKLVHKTVVDTSVVFPHRQGPPYKRALRNLTAEYLKKIIQNDVDGHDSQEDASACMELMLWKIKDDLKRGY